MVRKSVLESAWHTQDREQLSLLLVYIVVLPRVIFELMYNLSQKGKHSDKGRGAKNRMGIIVNARVIKREKRPNYLALLVKTVHSLSISPR